MMGQMDFEQFTSISKVELEAIQKALPFMSLKDKIELLDDIEIRERRASLTAAKTNMLGFATSVYPGFKIGPHHRKLAKIFTDVVEGKKKRVIINIAPRMGNGDEASGDGFKFRGRGILQLTGKNNYFWFAASLEITPEQAVDYLETFEGAAQSACWFWSENKLNRFVDADDFKGLTRAINGGYIGLEDRKHHYEIALSMFGSSS